MAWNPWIDYNMLHSIVLFVSMLLRVEGALGLGIINMSQVSYMQTKTLIHIQ